MTMNGPMAFRGNLYTVQSQTYTRIYIYFINIIYFALGVTLRQVNHINTAANNIISSLKF